MESSFCSQNLKSDNGRPALENNEESPLKSKKSRILGTPQSQQKNSLEKYQSNFQQQNSPNIYFIRESDLAIKPELCAVNKELMEKRNSMDDENILNLKYFVESDSIKNKENKNLEKIGPYKNYTKTYEIFKKGKTTKFQKAYSKRVLLNIDKILMRSLFVRYYNAIFIAKIMLIIACLVTLASHPRLQVFIVLSSQASFTFLVIWYQSKLKFLKMGCFYIFNNLFQEIVLTIFLFGAQILSFNEKGLFSEGMLIVLEFVMSFSLALSIFIELVALLGTMIFFVIEFLKLGRKCHKKKK